MRAVLDKIKCWFKRELTFFSEDLQAHELLSLRCLDGLCHIMLTCLCNLHPFTFHFHIPNLGFTGV